MITFTAFDALTLEHDRRTAKANRYGWLRSTPPSKRRFARFGAVLNAIGVLIHGTSSDRAVEPVSTGDVGGLATGQTQGAT